MNITLEYNHASQFPNRRFQLHSYWSLLAVYSWKMLYAASYMPQSINSIVFKYFTKQCPSYLNEVFELACPNNSRTRNSYLKLICPFQNTNMGQNALSFIGPLIWNKTPEVLKKTNSINTFKHNLKKYYPTQLK